MKSLALVSRPSVVERLASGPGGTSTLSRSRHLLRCARLSTHTHIQTHVSRQSASASPTSAADVRHHNITAPGPHTGPTAGGGGDSRLHAAHSARRRLSLPIEDDVCVGGGGTQAAGGRCGLPTVHRSAELPRLDNWRIVRRGTRIGPRPGDRFKSKFKARSATERALRFP